MWMYWGLFAWPSLAASAQSRMSPRSANRLLMLFAVLLALVIGLRYEVGMDWSNYMGHLENAQYMTLPQALTEFDPGYGFLNWVAAATGSGVWVVNLVCAIVFVSGFVAFAKITPEPWLAVTVGIPYMSIVTAMNYTRQGAALGLVMWALIALHDRRVGRFVVLILAASMFHDTAAALLPLGVFGFAGARNRFWSFSWIVLSCVIAYIKILSANREARFDAYFVQQYQSDGAGIRIAMNSAAAFVYLVFRKRFGLERGERRLWSWFAVATLLFIPALYLSPSSTVVDRVGLYFMPMQLITYSYLPRVFRPWRFGAIVSYLIVAAYAAVLFVWLNFSNYHYAWLPYRFYPLEVAW